MSRVNNSQKRSRDVSIGGGELLMKRDGTSANDESGDVIQPSPRDIRVTIVNLSTFRDTTHSY